MDIDNLSPKELAELEKKIQARKQRDKEKPLHDLFDKVVEMAKDEKINWGKFRNLVNDYNPEDDKTAKALQYKAKKPDGTYLFRQGKNAKTL